MAAAVASFPIPIADGVSHCGYHAESSFGAASYLIQRAEGNVLVDSPRFAAPLVRRLEALGGVDLLFLTHRDDVADHARFAEHFGCRRVMHEADVTARTWDVETRLEGTAPVMLAPDLKAIPVPGHTRGHTVLLYKDRFLFTGDHLAYDEDAGELEAWPDVCWYSWTAQTASMRRLLDERFEWVLPGHGRRHHASAPTMRDALRRLVEWMEDV
jgi:glyoxylase-like metal-dependent hydrolase (beta-lactamase superfamily II)